MKGRKKNRENKANKVEDTKLKRIAGANEKVSNLMTLMNFCFVVFKVHNEPSSINMMQVVFS